MLIALKILLTLAPLVVDSSRSPPIWTFRKEITVHGKLIIPASPLLSETESFAYAVCDNRSSQRHFIESRCNVTIEKPVLPYVTRKQTCPIHVRPDNLELAENLAQLSVTLLGEDSVVITWLQRERGDASMAKLKVLKMSNCRVVDVPIPVERIRFVVHHADGLDVVIYSKTWCNSPICKVRLNADGQIVSEPTEIVFAGLQQDSQYSLLGAAADGGFYLSNRFTGDRSRLYRINAAGKGDEVATFAVDKPFGYSAGYGFLSLCDSFTDTIACRSFEDASLLRTMDRVVEFHDEGAARWLQPYNMRDGAMLLVTGSAKSGDETRFDKFSVFRLEADGQPRKRLEVENLNFRCESARAMRVHVAESHGGDKVCFYFSCAHGEASWHKLQFAFKCYPGVYFGAAVPLTNGCFVASEDEKITDFTIYARI